MATVIKGLLSQNLPWALVLIGMGISLVVELCGVSSLAFAVGAYLPLSTTTPIFAGGIVKWLVDKRKKSQESETGPGALFSSGLIAGGAITGILVAVLIGWTVGHDTSGNPISFIEKVHRMVLGIFSSNTTGTLGEVLGGWGDVIGLILFVLLALFLFKIAMGKENKRQ